jgi:hypothetical protein
MTKLMSLSALTLQRLIGLPFLVLGAWLVVSPGTVQLVGVLPEARDGSALATLALQCFGAQALLCALFILTSRFTRYSFLAYGVALLPFFWFNWYFVFVNPLFTAGMLIDFVSNLGMLALCALGWQAARREGL